MLMWQFALSHYILDIFPCFYAESSLIFLSFLKAALCFRALTSHHLINPLLMDIWIVSILKNIFKQDILLLMSWHTI